MVVYSRATPVAVTSGCSLKTWTWTLANSADPDQTPQNAASDQDLHCLIKVHDVKGYMRQS